MTPQLEQLFALIEGRSGLLTRSDVVRRALRQCFVALGERRQRTPEQCLEDLRLAPTDAPAWTELLRLAANTQTSFLRDAPQLFAALGALGVQRARGEQRPLEIWCAACSTGEEAYSLAMLTLEADIPARVLATDLQEKVLHTARNGLYTRWSARQVSADRQAAWFEDRAGLLRVRDEVRVRVRFAPGNLLELPPRSSGPGGRWDLIFCRNVLIYFHRRRVLEILSRLAQALSPEGLIILGASESLQDFDAPVVPVSLGGAFAFRQRSASETPDPLLAPDPLSPVHAGMAEDHGSTAKEPAEPPQPSEAVVSLLQAGHEQLGRHAFEEASASYAAARAEAPLFAEAHLFEGLVHRRRGDLKGAAQMLRGALFLEPRCWPAAFLLAGVQERLGHHDLARRELLRTLAILEDTGPGFRLASTMDRAAPLIPDAKEAEAACRLRLEKT